MSDEDQVPVMDEDLAAAPVSGVVSGTATFHAEPEAISDSGSTCRDQVCSEEMEAKDIPDRIEHELPKPERRVERLMYRFGL